MSEQDLMTVRDVARACNRSEETVRRWIWSGKLKARKLGNQMFVSKDDFEAMHAPRAGETKTEYTARSRKPGRKPPMSEEAREVLAGLTKRREELVARYGAESVRELLRQVRDGEAFEPSPLRTKEEKLAFLEEAVALGKRIGAKYGRFNVSDLIHQTHEDEDD